MSSFRQASATSGKTTGVTTKSAPASFASPTAPGSHTVPTPIGTLPNVVPIRPRTISYQDGTVVVISIVPMPPSIAARQAWNAASALSVRMTQQSPVGKALSLRRLGDIQLAAFDLLVQAPRTERLRAYLPELFTRYREVIQEQLDRLEADGRVRLTVPREVLVPLVLNTVLGFGLYYVVTRDDESCLRALSAFNQLAATLVEPV